MKYRTGTAMRLISSEAISPAIKEMANPWKIGSKRMTAPPTITAIAVINIGRKRTAPASTTAASSEPPSRRRCSMKSTRMIEFRTTMPALAINPIIDVAVKNAPRSPCADRMPTSEKWNGGHYDERREERTEPADHQDVDENQHGGEGEPEIAKGFDCNVPFAVPFQGRFSIGEGLRSVIDRDRRAAPTELAAVEFLQGFIHGKDRIRGAFDYARHVADDVCHGHKVFVIEAFLYRGFLDAYELSHGNERWSACDRAGFRQCIGITGTNPQGEHFLGRGAQGAGKLQDDVYVLLLVGHMEQIHGITTNCETERLGNGFRAYSVQGGLFLVDDKAHLRLVGLDIPVHVHHAWRLFEDRNDFLGQGKPCFLRGAVNFGDKSLQYRRTGWHLGYGDARAIFLSDCRHERANAFGDVMALCFPVVLRDKIDLQVSHIRSASHEVVADESVEIKGRCRSRVDLVVSDLRPFAYSSRDFAGGLRGALERTAFRHVQDDLEFAFVVEWQHFHLYPGDDHCAHRGKE